MIRLLIIVSLEIFMSSCSIIHKCNSNDRMKQIYQLKVDNDLLLNRSEGEYLNVIFETIREDFNFIDKKIGFYTGSSGNKKSNKEQYLDMHKRHLADKNYPCDDGTLYIFDDAQKKDAGGYDAVIVYWSKITIPIEKVIERLKKLN